MPPLTEKQIGRLMGAPRPPPAPEVPVATERRGPSRVQFQATGEPDYTAEEISFMLALQDYKEKWHRPHLTCCEILAVVRALGYRKTAESEPLPRRGHAIHRGPGG